MPGPELYAWAGTAATSLHAVKYVAVTWCGCDKMGPNVLAWAHQVMHASKFKVLCCYACKCLLVVRQHVCHRSRLPSTMSLQWVSAKSHQHCLMHSAARSYLQLSDLSVQNLRTARLKVKDTKNLLHSSSWARISY